MKLRLLAPAVAELNEAVAWYAAQAPGLDQRFLDDVQLARRHIVEHPRAWHPVGDGVRRFRLKRFPYGLIYSVQDDEIIVLAVAHLHRAPVSWKDRLPK